MCGKAFCFHAAKLVLASLEDIIKIEIINQVYLQNACIIYCEYWNYFITHVVYRENHK